MSAIDNIENIDTIIDLLNSENREDFELGVNIIEAFDERPVINLKELNKDYEYAIINGRIRRRLGWINFKASLGESIKARYHSVWDGDKSWEED